MAEEANVSLVAVDRCEMQNASSEQKIHLSIFGRIRRVL